jgi:antitoxin MazE
MLETKIAKWGNSPAVRIPVAALKEAHFDLGMQVRVIISEERIVIEKAKTSLSLDQLIDGIPPENRHGEIAWGTPAGKEPW